MAIIELNLEKPALKRVESVKEKRVEEEQIEAEVNPEEVSEMAGEMEVEPTAESESSGTGGRSRTRKYGRRLAILGGTAAGVAAARRLQKRRSSGSQEGELEEDWQTVE